MVRAEVAAEPAQGGDPHPGETLGAAKLWLSNSRAARTSPSFCGSRAVWGGTAVLPALGGPATMTTFMAASG